MPGAVLTIGNFDGVHVGHAALVARARLTSPDAKVVALTFDPHPAAVLRPGSEPARLTTFDERRRLLREAGASEVVRLEPTRELLSMSPGEFIARLVAKYAPSAFVEGADFRFGHGRAGDIGALVELGREHGFEVITVPPVEAILGDHTVVAASSTLARWLIEHGRVGDAAAVLGRDYELEGEVIAGDRRGRSLGFPTANLRQECLPPADGVYAGTGTLPSGAAVPAAISVGTKPTFGERQRTVEAFLLIAEQSGANGAAAWQPLPGLPEYGWRLRLRFSAWVRDQVRFDSVASLVAQMTRDCDRTRQVVARGRVHSDPRKAVAAR